MLYYIYYASEVTTIWRYTNVYIIIIIIKFLLCVAENVLPPSAF